MQYDQFAKPKFNPSEAEKRANDFEMAKTIMSNYLDSGVDKKRIETLREDIGIHHGRWEAIEDLDNGYQITIDDPENEDGQQVFTIGGTKLRHFDKIGRITRGIHGKMISAPLVAIIKDISSKSKSLRDKLRLESVKEGLYDKYVVPKMEMITQQELMKAGAKNMFDLNPDQQNQIQSQISERVQRESPEEILAILEKVKTPDEQVCQLLFNYTASTQKLKYKYDMGGEFAIANGEEYYMTDIENGIPKLYVLVPEWVKHGGSNGLEGVEYGTFATCTQPMTIEQVIARHGLGFLQGDINNIDKYYNPTSAPGYTGNSVNNRLDIKMTEIIGKDPVLNQTNFLTRDGQQMLNALYSRVGAQISQYIIMHNFASWKWTARMKVVTQLYNGKPKEYIVAGHYRFNPQTDLKIRTIVVPQVWNGKRLGSDWFVDVGEKEYQYDSIQDPFNPKLSIYGGQYNTMMGTTKNYSLVGNGKIWNFKYNQIMAKEDEIRATDHGKITLMALNAKPKGIKWDDWLNGILASKIGIVAENTDFGLGEREKKVFQTIDMSRMADAISTIQEKQHIESEMYKAMYYSEAQTGNIGEYTTNQNASLQLNAAEAQLYSFYDKHRMITTSVSNAMLRLSLIAYRDNEVVKNAVLDDFLKSHYELNMSNEDISQYALVMLDTLNEMQSVKKMTDLALSFVQTGIISLKALSRLFSATTMAEAQDVIDESEEERKKERKIEMQDQKAMAEQNAKYQQDLMKMKQDYDALQKDLERKMKVTLADIGSHLLENAQDVDKNQIADSFQKALIEIASNERINESKISQQDKEHRDLIIIENKKLKLENEKLKKTTK